MKTLPIDLVSRMLVQNCRYAKSVVKVSVYCNGKEVSASNEDELILVVKKELLNLVEGREK